MTQLEESLTQEIKELRQKNADQDNKIRILEEQLYQLRKKLYGRRSEKTSVLSDATQLNLFNEAEVEAKAGAREPQLQETEVKAHRRKKQKGHKEELISSLPHEKEVCDVPEEERKCPRHPGVSLVPLGEKLIRTEVRHIPAQIKVVEIWQKSYQCPACREEDHFTVMKGKVPQALLPQSIASASSVAEIIHQKYELGVPLYRQEPLWKSMGLSLPRARMAYWLIALNRDYLSSLAGYMHQLLLRQPVLHCDETVVQVMNEEGRRNTTKSYMWVMCSGPFSDMPPIRLFRYRPGRSGDFARELLTGFHGVLVRDQYGGYNKVEDITPAGCWAHLRRKFIEASPKGADEPPETLTGQAILQIRKIFEIERDLQDHTPEERQKERQERAKPLVDAFFAWVESHRPEVTAKCKLREAMDYALNGRKTYYTYLENGLVSQTNAAAENSIRPFAVGRKNWLFSNSPKGADASASIYSLIETCKANKVEPYRYFEYILIRLPNNSSPKTAEDFERYMPWDPEIQANCKL